MGTHILPSFLPVIPSMDPSLLLPLGSDWTSGNRNQKAPITLHLDAVKDKRIQVGFFSKCVVICKYWGQPAGSQDEDLTQTRDQNNVSEWSMVLMLKPAVIVYSGLFCLYILAVWVSLKAPNKTVTNTCSCVPGWLCCKSDTSLLCNDHNSELMSLSLT